MTRPQCSHSNLDSKPAPSDISVWYTQLQGQTSGLGSSSGQLSDNPFNFPNPGGDSAAGDSTVGMEDDAPSGLSQQHTTGGYDFSHSLQPAPFSFSAGQSQSILSLVLVHLLDAQVIRPSKQYDD